MRVRRLNESASRPGDDGAVAILTALLITLFLILAAFALDIGNAYAQGRQISVAMDAAALSAAGKVGSAMPIGQNCTPAVLTSIGAQGIAQTEADAINTKNRKNGQTEIVDSVTVGCADSGNAIEVTVRNNRGVPTALAGIIGINSVNPGNYATARFVRKTVAGGLRPWAVCDSTLLAAQASPNDTFWTALGNWSTKDSVGICGTSAPGQWGSVDFDGGGNSANVLADWTLNGYPGAVTIPDPAMPADPGVSNSSALRAAFQSLVNQVVLFPAVSRISGNGNNAVFNAVGIATVKVCGVVYNNNVINSGSTCWKTPSPSTSTSSTKDTNYGPYTTTGTIAKNSTQLTVAAAQFGLVPSGTDIVNVATITVKGAGKKGAGLVSKVTLPTPLPTTVITLADSADTAVTNAQVTITVVSTKTTTTVVPGFGLYDDKGNLQDQIQFQWVNYSTSSYTGPGGGSTCALSNRLCVGQTVLWR